MKKFIVLLLLFTVMQSYSLSEEYIQEVRQLIRDVKSGLKDKSALNQRTRSHCEAPLFLLTKQNMWLEKLKGTEQLYTQLISDLLDQGADPNTANHDTETILGNAVKCSSSAVVEILLNKGANPHERPKREMYGQAKSIRVQLLEARQLYRGTDILAEFDKKLQLLDRYSKLNEEI